MKLETGKTNLVFLALFIGFAFAPELAAPAFFGGLATTFALFLDNADR